MNTQDTNMNNDNLETRAKEAWKHPDPLDRMPVPIAVLTGEALDVARFVQNHWEPLHDIGTGGTIPGLSSAVGGGRLTVSIGTEILQIAAPPTDGDVPNRARPVLSDEDDTPVPPVAESDEHLRVPAPKRARTLGPAVVTVGLAAVIVGAFLAGQRVRGSMQAEEAPDDGDPAQAAALPAGSAEPIEIAPLVDVGDRPPARQGTESETVAVNSGAKAPERVTVESRHTVKPQRVRKPRSTEPKPTQPPTELVTSPRSPVRERPEAQLTKLPASPPEQEVGGSADAPGTARSGVRLPASGL